ncbi:MAG: energy transducer TonB [Opitutaceae bacterium]|jgi:TonB family protein|nr:energy transducer TonB [Opitutaceae bacterium]
MISTRVAPVYPRALREKGVQGFATVEVRVDSTGRVVEAELVRSTLPEFGERALQAARGWTFKPAMAQGRPITARVRLPFEFVMPQVAALEGR